MVHILAKHKHHFGRCFCDGNNYSVAYRGFLVLGQEVKLTPHFVIFFPQNIPKWQPQSKFRSFYKSEKRKTKTISTHKKISLFPYIYTSTKRHKSMCQMVGLLFFTLGKFQCPLKRSPAPLVCTAIVGLNYQLQTFIFQCSKNYGF